jgi:hypothetical protein
MHELVLDVSFKGMLVAQRQIGVWPQSFTDTKIFIKHVIFVKYYFFSFVHMHPIFLSHFCLQMCKQTKIVNNYFEVCNKGGIIDLVIDNVQEGLSVLGLSMPNTYVPPWNTLNPIFFNCLSYFCTFFFHNDGVLLIFYLDDLKVFQ